MKKIILLSALALWIFAIGGCEKDKSNLPLDFELRLLDTLGNKKTVFNYGENIVFSFVINNRSSEDIFIENFLPNKDFFNVYKYANSLDETSNFGKPYEFPTKIGYYSIKQHESFEIIHPWTKSKDENLYCVWIVGNSKKKDLEKGDYHTEFSQSFKISYFSSEKKLKTEEKHFNINFTIK